MNLSFIITRILDSPYYIFEALCIVVIVVSLVVQDGLFFVLTRARTFKKARVRCAIANNKIFTKTFNIFVRGRYLYQWYHYNHNAKRYENVIRGILNYMHATTPCPHFPNIVWTWSVLITPTWNAGSRCHVMLAMTTRIHDNCFFNFLFKKA